MKVRRRRKMGNGGGGGDGGEEAPAVVPVEASVTTEPQMLIGARMVGMPAELLDCHACHLALKPPIFKCDAEHLVCSSCHGVHGESCGRAVGHSALADAFATAATVLCDYVRYGCEAGGVVYHEAADHRRACQHAPCGCPESAGAVGDGGCGFTGSRQKLLDHISGPDHSRPIIVIRYGQPWNLSLPLSHRWHVLVGEEEQAAAGADRHRNLFLVSVGERGETTAVSLVCVRADGGAPGGAQFACKLAVEHSGDGTRLTLESPLVGSSSLSGDAPALGDVKCLPVPKEYLSGDSVPLSIHIDKFAPHPPVTPTLLETSIPSCPAATTAPVKSALTDQSNKKRKSMNPREV